MRKTYFLFIVIVAVSTINTILGMSQQTSLAHLLIQIKAVKRTWDEERVRIQIAKKASPVLYQKISPLFEKIIASTDFNNKMNTAVDEQVEAIANQGKTFKSVKKDIALSDFFTTPMHQYGQTLFAAMANKAYAFLLGQKLVEKIKEIQQQQQESSTSSL